MKEEKDSTTTTTTILSFGRKNTNRLSLHLDRKKEKKEDGQVKRASWSSFPLLRFSSSSSTSSSSSSSPMAQEKRGLGRKCSSSDEIKHLSLKNSPPKITFQRGSNASIRSSVSTSSTASSTSSGVRTGGSSSITSILEGSGSDTFSCDSYNGNTGDFHPYPVNRTASEVIHPKRHDTSLGKDIRETRDDCLSMPSLAPLGNISATSPRILYAHRKTPEVKHRSRQQLEQELEAVRRAGSLPVGLEAHTERSIDVRATQFTPVAEKSKPKHKKSFSFIHNSKFLGRLEARTRREGKSIGETEDETDYSSGVGQSDKQTTASTSSLRSSVSLHLQETPPAHLHHHHQYITSTQVSLQPSPTPPPPPLPRESSKSSPTILITPQNPKISITSPHSPSPPLIIHHSQSPNHHRSTTPQSLSPPQPLYAHRHNTPTTRPTPTPTNTATPTRSPPLPFFQHTDGLASSPPPQYSLAAFLNYAFGSGERALTSHRTQTPPSSPTQPPQPPPPPPPYTEAVNPRYLETNLDNPLDTVRNYANLVPEIHHIRTHQATKDAAEHHQNKTQYLQAINPKYLETSFDSPLDFVTERNYANLLPDTHQKLLFKGKDPCQPLTRSEYGEFELKQSFLGVIGDTIEEEEEEGAESECEIGELLCQVDSTCFERTMEDKLEEMAGRVEEEEGEAEENVVVGQKKEEGHKEEGKKKGGKASKKPNLRLQLIKPENDMVKRVQRSRLLRHISEDSEGVSSGGEEDVELRTPTTPRSPAIEIADAFEQKQREIAEDKDEMERLRDLTTRLQLTTRRPSYLDWAAVLKERGRRVGEALATHTPTVVEMGGAGHERGQEGMEEVLGVEVEEEEEEEEEMEELTMDRRKHNLQTAVDWVRKELTDMRQQDQQLAKQLLQLRVEVQRLRLLHSCLHTTCLLEEVTSGAEEAKLLEGSDLCDLPPDLRETFSPVLREMGLTRMNITSRRFSLR